MTSKILLLSLIGLFITGQAIAETKKKTSKARAYRAHLMTFLWPEESSSEKIDYEYIADINSLTHFSTPPKKVENNNGFSFGIGIGEPKITNPFDEYKKQLSKKVSILSNQTWPMIFEQRSSTVEQSFYSDQFLDGYPVLQGTIKVTLGRYLETEISYQHYQFESFSVPALFSMSKGQEKPELGYVTAPILLNAAASFNIDNDEDAVKPTIELYQPNGILNLTVERKTASKKLNYLDHPIIGSLLYFEPIKVEEAEQEIMLNEIESELDKELTELE